MRKFLILAFLLSSSASVVAKEKEAVHYPLPAGTPIEVIRDSQDAMALGHPNAGPGAGLIAGGIIGSWMANNERALAPLRAQLAPEHLDEHFVRAVAGSLEGVVANAKPEIVDGGWQADQLTVRTAASGGLYVALRPYRAFTLELDGAGAFIELWVIRIEPRGDGKLREHVIDHRVFSFVQHFPGWTPSVGYGSIAIWNGLGAPGLALAFRQDMEQAVAMLAYYVTPEGQAEAALKNKKSGDKLFGIKVPGRLVRQGANWFWFREKLRDDLTGYGVIGKMTP